MGSIGMLRSISGAAAEEVPVSWTAAQRSHCDARWEEYLRQQNLEGLWRGPLGKEQDRYRPVLESLAAEDRVRQRQSTAIREQKMKWSVKLRCRETRERLAQYKGELKTIFDAANEDLRYQTQRQQMEAAHQRHLAANHRCATRLVKLPGGSDEDACELEVATSLSRTRYYLGHKGGDYIFRYQEFYAFYSLYREFGAGGDAWDPNGPVCHHPGSEVNLQCDEETRSDFQYCGQVPRTWKEYASRFEMVCQDIMRLFGSVISFEPLGDGVLINEVYRPCLEVTNIGVKSLNRLEKTWNVRVAKDSAFFSWVQSMAAGNFKLLEFAFLLNRLDEMSGGLFKKQVRSLVELFGSVTDKTLPEMCEAYEGIMKEEAMKELLDERNFEHCMVFEDDTVEDPHAFYANNEFCSDLDHPRNRFNPPPIQRALETAFNLLCYDWDLRDPTSEATLTQLCDQLGLCSCRDIILPAAIERLRQRAQEPCSEPSSRDDNAAAASRPVARAARRGRPPKRRASPSAQTAARPRSSRRRNG
ncbi:hypothetical protein VFPPC_16150 [Pochonia chlamydosporia 170]|uniref:Uncharacterized protein n=1 Tax=Pochonia chlamydosporia 170 TaxID=1380566 RepID=A0A179FEX0_METCM|nr:hypothetical protein VFPPC_16150 [Pochonia chlamydosporia 170]OAQ64062.1 hypothetical protein VFPPC_16150 [Pochonia chlamydosporia 170]